MNDNIRKQAQMSESMNTMRPGKSKEKEKATPSLDAFKNPNVKPKETKTNLTLTIYPESKKKFKKLAKQYGFNSISEFQEHIIEVLDNNGEL